MQCARSHTPSLASPLLSPAPCRPPAHRAASQRQPTSQAERDFRITLAAPEYSTALWDWRSARTVAGSGARTAAWSTARSSRPRPTASARAAPHQRTHARERMRGCLRARTYTRSNLRAPTHAKEICRVRTGTRCAPCARAHSLAFESSANGHRTAPQEDVRWGPCVIIRKASFSWGQRRAF